MTEEDALASADKTLARFDEPPMSNLLQGQLRDLVRLMIADAYMAGCLAALRAMSDDRAGDHDRVVRR